MNKCTIIIPVYVTRQEGLKWLEECFESAVAQKDCDIAAYDDGSTIDISGVAKKFAKYVDFTQNRGHHGVSFARNEAANYANTELIFPLDCDDRLVPNAVEKLLSVWDGTTPVYPDVAKFGIEIVPHYTLLDFACEHILNHIGFSSVNVLHLKDQWKSVGGWNENTEFYEDGEYNAKLFARYCGKRFPEPLIEYRIHENQRTKRYKAQSAVYARQILSNIRRLDMACPTCGGGRRQAAASSQFQTPMPAAALSTSSLPGEMNGRLLVQYIGGKGRGKHYYRGLRTKFPYKVTYGDNLYVDPADIRQSGSDSALFIRVESQQPVATPVQISNTEEPSRSARKLEVEKVPVVDNKVEDSLPEIAGMSVKDIRNLDDMNPELAKKLLILEKNGHNRAKIVAYLESVIAHA